MNVGVDYVISYAVAIGATFILSVYFFREYTRKKLRTSLAWAVGLLIFSVTQIFDLYVAAFGEITLGKPILAIALIVHVFGMVLLYYGTSLLFFETESFFREKLSALIMSIYIVYFGYIVAVLPVEGFREAVLAPIQLGLMTPIFLAIAISFYYVSRSVERIDPRRLILLLVSAGWFLEVIDSLYRGLFLGSSGTFDATSNVLRAVGWIFIFYGMIIGKVMKF